MLRKREAATVSDDDMIQHPDFHEREGIAQAAGNVLIRLAGLHDAGRVVVGENRP